MRLALVVAALSIGCGGRGAAPAPAVPTTTAQTSATSDAGCRIDARVVAEARQLRVSEVSDGHQGWWRLHVDLTGHEGGDFVGTVIAGYAASHRDTDVPRSSVRRVGWSRAELAEFVAQLGAGLSASPVPDGSRFIVDTSRSIYIALDIVGEGGAVQFAVDDGHVEPLGWRLRGCDHELTYEARQALTRRWRALRDAFGADALHAELAGAPPWPRD